MTKIDKVKLESKIINYHVHATSPYNDGWTREHYRKLHEEESKKLKQQHVKDRSK